jgi:hypothetical protein
MECGISSFAGFERRFGNDELFALLKTTAYFRAITVRPDRIAIVDAWIQHVLDRPEREYKQQDGRVRYWARIPEADNRWLRVVLLADRETVHNAFFDRGFKP